MDRSRFKTANTDSLCSQSDLAGITKLSRYEVEVPFASDAASIFTFSDVLAIGQTRC